MRYFKILALMLGLVLFAWIVRQIGLAELQQGFRRLGWNLLWPVIIISPGYFLYTLSWQLFLKRFEHHPVGFWTLFRIKVAGEATNTLTPLNFAGGDPIRVWLLSKRIPVAIGGASVVVDRTLHSLAIATLVCLGNLAAVILLEFPGWARVMLGLTSTLMALLVFFLLFQQTRGLFQKLFRLLSRLRLKKVSEETWQQLAELDQHLHDFYRQDRPLFLFCFSLHFLSRLIGIVEIIVIARLLGVPMGIGEGVFFAAVIPMTNLLGALVPGTFGVMEGVVSSLFVALRWSAADGLVLQIVRRLRAGCWILLGLSFILLERPPKGGRSPLDSGRWFGK